MGKDKGQVLAVKLHLKLRRSEKEQVPLICLNLRRINRQGKGGNASGQQGRLF